MDTLKTKFQQIEVLRAMKFTIKQSWIIRHLIEYEFLYRDDMQTYCYSDSALKALVKSGVIDRHPKMMNDELHYDLSNEWHKRIKAAMNNG